MSAELQCCKIKINNGKLQEVVVMKLLVREGYENLWSKSLPNNFFTNMFLKVCSIML